MVVIGTWLEMGKLNRNTESKRKWGQIDCICFGIGYFSS
jgi:hypothetical protein